MTYTNSHCRKMFVFDSKVINEQACRDDAIRHLTSGNERRIEIHKHKATEDCPNRVVAELQNTQQLLALKDNQCYAFTKETDVVSGR